MAGLAGRLVVGKQRMGRLWRDVEMHACSCASIVFCEWSGGFIYACFVHGPSLSYPPWVVVGASVWLIVYPVGFPFHERGKRPAGVASVRCNLPRGGLTNVCFSSSARVCCASTGVLRSKCPRGLLCRLWMRVVAKALLFRPSFKMMRLQHYQRKVYFDVLALNWCLDKAQ